jgi:hypothetical protein
MSAMSGLNIFMTKKSLAMQTGVSVTPIEPTHEDFRPKPFHVGTVIIS